MTTRQHKGSVSFQKAVLTVLAAASTDWMVKHGAPAPPPSLSAEQKQTIKEAFDMLDADGSGEVGVEELMEAYAIIDMPMTRAQAQAMMDEVDADGSGQMEFEEFKALMGKAMNKPTEVGASEAGTVPISDMALAFRRKKMLDAAMNGGEGREKLARLYEPPSKPAKLLPKLPGAASKQGAAQRIACVANAVLTLSRQTSQEGQQLLQMVGSLSRHGSLTPSPAGSKRGSLDLPTGHASRSSGGHTPSRQSLEAAAARAFSSGGLGSLPHLTSGGHAASPGDAHASLGLNPALSAAFVRVPCEGGWRAAGLGTGGLSPGGGLGSGDGAGCSSPKAYGVHSSLLAIASAKAARALMDGRASGSSGPPGLLLQVPYSSSGSSSPSGALSPAPHAAASTFLSSGRFSSPGSPMSCSPMALNPASFGHTALNPGSGLSPSGHSSRPALTATLQLCKSMRSMGAGDGADRDVIEEEDEDEEDDSDADEGAPATQPVAHGLPNKQRMACGRLSQPGVGPSALHGPDGRAYHVSSGGTNVLQSTPLKASYVSSGGAAAALGPANSSSTGIACAPCISGAMKQMNTHITPASPSSISSNPSASTAPGAIQMALHSSLYSSSSSPTSTANAPHCPPTKVFAAKPDSTAIPTIKRTSSTAAPVVNSLAPTSVGVATPAYQAIKIPDAGSGTSIPGSSGSGRRSRDVARSGAGLLTLSGLQGQHY